MTDNRTTETGIDRLRALLDEHDVAHYDGAERTLWGYEPTGEDTGIYRYAASEISGGFLQFDMFRVTPEQAIAATLGRPKAKAHPYGYEPDTGAFDCTRCECGCINDISAKYCNDCGGEIEIDMYAEKEIYHCPRHLVFAEKHDDGSLEFDGKRYIAATLGSEREKELESLVRDLWCAITWMHGMSDKKRDELRGRVSEFVEVSDDGQPNDR